MFRLGQKERQLKNLLGSDQIIPGFFKHGRVFYAFFPEQKRLQKDLHKPTPMDFPGIKH
jgi:hypothetical protein